MSALGVGVWMIGSGVAKLPNLGMVGAALQIVGGIIVVIGFST